MGHPFYSFSSVGACCIPRSARPLHHARGVISIVGVNSTDAVVIS